MSSVASVRGLEHIRGHEIPTDPSSEVTKQIKKISSIWAEVKKPPIPLERLPKIQSDLAAAKNVFSKAPESAFIERPREKCLDAVSKIERAIETSAAAVDRQSSQIDLEAETRKIITLDKRLKIAPSLKQEEFDASLQELDAAEQAITSAPDELFTQIPKRDFKAFIAQIRGRLNALNPNAWKWAMAGRAVLATGLVAIYGVPIGLGATALAYGVEKVTSWATPKINQAVSSYLLKKTEKNPESQISQRP